ncbi:ECF RNA polymerase sigma factor SigL [Planctomycetes bacterium Poly30]|uniref:ECF RNA polymerase sigma factor SigL n=1 Tax=Saltatorellus ferox TaxID=2528018 RepID=A0A518EP02_9BACT|nr:ECF RNA polymerase sigma factor SigL [Planctomycetes bacterium Poly30]
MSEAHPDLSLTDSSLTDVAWLIALARTLTRDGADADDLVQETWMIACTSPPPHGGLNRPWLATVLRRFHLQSLRSERRRVHRAKSAARREAMPDTAELVERAELQRALADCLLSLEDPYRTTLMLVAFEGVTTAEIAERDGVSVGVVRYRVRKAREAMRAKLMASDGEDWSQWCAVLLPFARLSLPGEAGAAHASASPMFVAASAWIGALSMTFKLLVSLSIVVVLITAATSLDKTQLNVTPQVVRDVERVSSAVTSPLLDAIPAKGRRESAPSIRERALPEAVQAEEPVEAVGAPAPSPRRITSLATLEIRIRSQEMGWFASLMADEPPFPGGNGPSWSTGDLETGYQMNSSAGQGAGQTYALSNLDGVYRFLNVRPGVPLRVAAVDGFFFAGDEVEVSPLLPGEDRVVEVVVTRELRRFQGRVLSPDGEPIEGASLQLSVPGETLVTGDHTGPDGAFRTQPMKVEELILAVRAKGFATTVDTRFAVPNGPIDIFLERGRPVRILVRDAEMRWVEDAEIIGRETGAGVCYSARGRTNQDGVCRLEAVSSVDLPLEISVNGRTFHSTLLAHEVEHIVEVPTRQSCFIRVNGPRTARLQGAERIALRPVAPTEGEVLMQALQLSANEAIFERVFPGTYEATLERIEKESVVWTSDPVMVDVKASGPNETSLDR